jgi:hypothetical protein
LETGLETRCTTGLCTESFADVHGLAIFFEGGSDEDEGGCCRFNRGEQKHERLEAHGLSLELAPDGSAKEKARRSPLFP